MTEQYYNHLSPHYKHIYQDWNASVKRQAVILNALIRENFGDGVKSILDAACGIGTQAIGLAEQGYRLTASDISASEIEEARQEAGKRKLEIDFEVVDMRFVWNHFGRQFDLVIACDNAIPHLLTDEDILATFEQFFQCVRPNGGCLISVRDYDHLEHGETKLYPRQVHQTNDGQILLFDYWQFEGDYYDMTTYVIEDKGEPLATTHVIQGGRYYCITTEKLEHLMSKAGFDNVKTIHDRFFQPVIVGIKPLD